jgi:hypothetical protein
MLDMNFREFQFHALFVNKPESWCLTNLALSPSYLLARVPKNYGPATHEAVAALYSLGELVEYPARALLPDASFYAVALTAAAGYLILYILVGLLRGRMYRQP